MPNWSRKSRAARMMALCGSLVACAGVTVAGVTASSASVAPAVFPVTVTVGTSGTPIGAIDDHFVGLSLDSTLLNSGLIDNAGDLPQLMRNLGSSVMRFGGGAVDGLSFSGATPGALAGLARLAAATGWTVIYSENLGHYDAAAVEADAGRVSQALGGRLAAFACGNEPNLFGTQGLRPGPYLEPDYIQDARACIAQIQAGAPGAPVEGADLTGGPKFLAAYAKDMKGKLAFLGQHYYPLGCGLQGMTPRSSRRTSCWPARRRRWRRPTSPGRPRMPRRRARGCGSPRATAPARAVPRGRATATRPRCG